MDRADHGDIGQHPGKRRQGDARGHADSTRTAAPSRRAASRRRFPRWRRMPIRLDLAVPDPKLWSVDAPNLYTLRVRLAREGQPDDQRLVRIGFRTFRFDADKGFFLNGEPLKIKGIVHPPGSCRRRRGDARRAVGMAHAPPEGAGLQRDPLLAQRACRRAAGRRRPAGHARHGREPQFQHQPRLYRAARLAGAARPQPAQHHPVVGVQRRADAGDRGGLRDGPPHGEGSEGAGRQPAGHRGDERRPVHTQ